MSDPAAGPATFVPLNGAHWLHPQKSSRVPRRYVFLDTEAHRAGDRTGETQAWRLGVTGTIRWRDGTRAWGPLTLARHTTPGSLWAAVDAFCRRDFRTVAVAHNLAYDLRISDAFRQLAALGWSVHRPAWAGERISLEMRRDGRVLVLVDSLSLIPHALGEVGAMLGMAKPPLPEEDDSPEAWWARCEADVAILARAYMAVIDRLASGDLGGWARSGPGVGWHVMLRRHLHDQVLVHAEPAARLAEGQSMAAGRCEVWRWGRQTDGPYHLWDYAMAYAHVCRELPLPAVLVGETRGVSMDTLSRPPAATRWLVHAEVATDVEVLPWRDALGVCWPTGRFDGWWWDVELAEAEAAGATIRPRWALRYRAAPWLTSFARFCIDAQADTSSGEAAVWAAVTKHWARTVVGRTAMQYRVWREAGEAWSEGVTHLPLVDLDDGSVGAALQLGGQRWEAWRTEWWDSALPQVLSAVMASCRVQLWRAMSAAGLRSVLYVDTDALLVDAEGHRRLQAETAAGRLGSLRYKGAHAWVEPIAPQLVEGSTFRRLAGIPKGAARTGPGTYTADVWDGLAQSMASGRPDQVRIRRRPFTLAAVDLRRLHLPGGVTAAYRVEGGCRVDQREEAS